MDVQRSVGSARLSECFTARLRMLDVGGVPMGVLLSILQQPLDTDRAMRIISPTGDGVPREVPSGLMTPAGTAW